MWYMQPCCPVPRAGFFWRGYGGLSSSGRVIRRERGLWQGTRSCPKQTHPKQALPKHRTVMVETTEKTGEKKLSVTPTKTLTLKGRGVESGMVRQTFSHGLTKTVVFEKVKSRPLGKPKLEPAPAPEKVVPK